MLKINKLKTSQLTSILGRKIDHQTLHPIKWVMAKEYIICNTR